MNKLQIVYDLYKVQRLNGYDLFYVSKNWNT